MEKKRDRVLLLDVDGTLVCPARKRVDAPTAAALTALQRRGVTVALATGRTMTAVRPEVMGGFVPDCYLCINGAYVAGRGGEVLRHQPMERTQFEAILDIADREGYPLGFSFPECYYTYIKDAVYRPFYKENNGDMVTLRNGEDRTRHLRGLPCAAFGILPPEGVKALLDTVPELHITPFRENVYDICRRGCTKRTGAEVLLERLGLSWEDAVMIGDGENDLELLEAAGLGIAMGNASETVKARADAVTGSVLEDGVLSAIRQYFPTP